MKIEVTGEAGISDIEVNGSQPSRVINVSNSLVPDPVGRSEIGEPGGIAGLDSDGTVPDDQIPATVAPAATTARRGLGTYVPPAWGARWRATRDTAALGGKARMVCVGDSVTMGFQASNPLTASWVGRVRTALQAQYGDGGQGFFTSMYSTISGSGSQQITTAWTAAGAFATSTGTWAADAASVAGPGIYEVETTTVGSSITFPARGSIVKIYTLTGTVARAGYTYSIDGGAAVSVADSGGTGAAAIQVTTVSGIAATTHTVKITHNGTAGQKLSVVGVGSENASGVVVDNLGRSAAKATGFSLNDPAALNAVWNGGASYPTDLVIYALGVNDAGANTTADTWAANVGKYLKAVRESGDGSTDVVLLMNHIGAFEGTNAKYQDYVQRSRGLADAYNAALVDMWTIGHNSYNYWSQLGYWGDAANPGAAGTDNVHLSDAGHNAVANAMLPILTS